MFKRKLKLIKVVKVDIPAYIIHNNEKFPEYRCTECGFSVADGDVYCSCCGNELDWNIDKNQGEYIEFRSIIDGLEKDRINFKKQKGSFK